MSVFWAVWRKNGGSPPTMRHQTKEAAVLEAHRLAQNTKETYYVLQVVGAVQVPDIAFEYVNLYEEDDTNESI